MLTHFLGPILDHRYGSKGGASAQFEMAQSVRQSVSRDCNNVLSVLFFMGSPRFSEEQSQIVTFINMACLECPLRGGRCCSFIVFGAICLHLLALSMRVVTITMAVIGTSTVSYIVYGT